jgi:two-component system phosphate regulon sensor histidine kinase PhoR
VRRSGLAVFLLLFSSFLVMIAVAAYSVLHNVQSFWDGTLRQEITRNLTQKAQMFASRVDADHATPIAEITSEEGLHAGARATVVDANGKVVADSQAPVASLENEGQLPEFVGALRGETTTKIRDRNRIPVLYVAVPVPGGAVRLACPMADLEIAEQKSSALIFLGCGIAILAGLAISMIAAKAVSGP